MILYENNSRAMGAIYRARSTRSRAESSFAVYKSPVNCPQLVRVSNGSAGYRVYNGPQFQYWRVSDPCFRGSRYLE